MLCSDAHVRCTVDFPRYENEVILLVRALVIPLMNFKLVEKNKLFEMFRDI